ncbi:LysR family transcriptional regulator [Serratia quinivorans]|uniref:LysR family transcriptional regulator n=1 Tax=Serratia quinivorans TaxID=137545 RepID=UPI003F9E2F95
MNTDLEDLHAFLAVARTGGFREGARTLGRSASSVSDAIRRLEKQLGVRLFNRTTRSVTPTAAGYSLQERLAPALDEVQSALDVVNGFRDKPVGMLKLNVPMSAARLVLPALIPAFLTAYPDIKVEIQTEESFVDVLAAGCDAGIRYEERLEKDMIAVPIGPRVQRFAAAASPAYLARCGRPAHPQELFTHACLLGRFPSGKIYPWEFERQGERLEIAPDGPLMVQAGGATDLAVAAAIAGIGIIYLFEDWLAPSFASGELEPVLEAWWPQFSGPFLYYSDRRFIPSPLRAFIDFIRQGPRATA